MARRFVKNRRKKKIVLVISLVLFVMLGIGYSTLSTQLSINGELSLHHFNPTITSFSQNQQKYYRSNEYREKIKTITIETSLSTPQNAVVTWDISEDQDGNVLAHLIPNSSDSSMYDLIIQGNGILYANEDSSWLFAMLTNVEEINNLSLINTSKVTNLEWIFTGLNKLSSIDGLENWDTSNVTSMSYLFFHCSSLTSLEAIKNWDVKKVTSLRQTFASCYSVEEIDLSNWETSSLVDMYGLFGSWTANGTAYTNNKLKRILISDKFDTSKVTNMELMFANQSKIESYDFLRYIDTSHVTSLNQIFQNNTNAVVLDLSGWDTSSVTNMSSMFEECTNLQIIWASELWSTSLVTESSNMFYHAPLLPNFNPSYIDKTRAHYNSGGYLRYKDISFDGNCYTSDYVQGVPVATGKEYVRGQYTYKYNYGRDYDGNINTTPVWVENTTLNGWGVILTDSTSTNPAIGEICTYINDEPIKSTEEMYTRSKATIIDISSFDTSNVTTMHAMFSFARNVTTLVGVENLNTSNVTNMGGMFNNLISLSHINTYNLDTSKVTEMGGMFYGFKGTHLDLHSFDTSNVAIMERMFYDCPNLTTIYVSDLWDTSSVTSSGIMFYNDTSLPNFNPSYIDKTRAHYNSGGYLTYKARS